MFKTIYSLSFFLLLCTGFAQSSQMPFNSMGAGRMEEVKVGGLYDIELSYEFRINEEGFFLDTVKVTEDQIAGYLTETLDYFSNKISTSQYDYEIIVNISKEHLGQPFFNDILTIKGTIYLEGESADDFSVVHEILDAEKVSSGFVFFQYVFEIHNWLLLASALVLLIVKTPLNLRHGLIIAIPLLGPGVYLTKETIRFIRARKKKGNKRKAQSKQHPQSATHALES